MQIELKPCPFCGETPPEIVDATKILGVHRIVHRCKVIPAFSIEAATPERAAEVWNTRSPTTATPPDVAKIARSLEALAEHLSDQPLTHADSTDLATIRQAATALRLSAGGGWRTMDSAPHGVNVLLAYWDEALGGWHMEAGMASWGWRRGGVSNMSAHGQATHWQPLPSPPASPTVEGA